MRSWPSMAARMPSHRNYWMFCMRRRHEQPSSSKETRWRIIAIYYWGWRMSAMRSRLLAMMQVSHICLGLCRDHGCAWLTIHWSNITENIVWPLDTFSSATSPDIRRNHIDKTSAIIRGITQQNPSVIRPSNAANNGKINEAIHQEHGLKTLLWSIDSKDWEMTEPKAIVASIMAKVKPGDVIVFRDSRSHVVEAVSLLVDALFTEGYELLTASEMLSFPDDTPRRR